MGALLKSSTLFTLSFEAMETPPTISASSIRWYSIEGMMPTSAWPLRTAPAHNAGVVKSRSNLPRCSPLSIPQIKGTVLRYLTTETRGLALMHKQSKVES